MADTLLRKINLAEVLREQLDEAGMAAPQDLTDVQLATMNEAEIRAHYAGDCGQSAAAAHDDLAQRFPPQDSTAAFKAYFPALSSSRGRELAPARPTAVILCFHSSGNAEDMFTSEGTGARRVQSALLEACKAHNWLLLAPQLPGRAQRMREPPLNTLQELGQQLVPLVAPAVLAAGGKWGVIGHSLGCWAAYEVALALRAAGLAEPAVMCLSAMPAPHIPFEQRPWRQQKDLSEQDFREECRGWDINEAVFSPGMWEMYEPLLRADFRLFDEYQPSNTREAALSAPFASKLRLFWGERDRRVTQDMVKEWRSYVTSEAQATPVAGHHLWPISEPSLKAAWLQEVAAALKDPLPH